MNITHFGAETGTNAFGEVSLLVVAGRPLPAWQDATSLAEAIFGEAIPEDQREYVQVEVTIPIVTDDAGRNGVVTKQPRALHPNVEVVRRSITEASIAQAVAPASFGALAGSLLIGNFGNGHIDAYNPATGEFIDKMCDPGGLAIVIDGLWSLRVGNGGNGGRDRYGLFHRRPEWRARRPVRCHYTEPLMNRIPRQDAPAGWGRFIGPL